MAEPFEQKDSDHDEISSSFDFARVSTPARIACYDDPKAAPRVVEIQPNTTLEFIEDLAARVYELSHAAGGGIAYTAIREVAENFIHARFTEVVVSILDNGNTIRFADQGPGISHKDQALRPGFTSATEPMKRFIRGVGSGFPLTAEYLEAAHGSITIEDNLSTGAVVTLSLVDRPAIEARRPAAAQRGAGDHFDETPLMPALSEREKLFLPFFLNEGPLGVTDLVSLTGVPQSSTYNVLKHLEKEGILQKTTGQKRELTDFGYRVARSVS